MSKRMALLAVTAVVFLTLFSPCISAGLAFPTPLFSNFLAANSPTKLRIESFFNTPGIDFCVAWLHGSGRINSTRLSYVPILPPVVTPITNPVPNAASYIDVDVVDGTTDCNVVGLEAEGYYLSGDTTFNIVTAPNSTAIGVSFLTSGFKALVRDTNNALEPFSGSFAGNIETRAMTESLMLVATALRLRGILIATVTRLNSFTILANISTAIQPISISAAAYSDTNWVVCAIMVFPNNLGCIFSQDPTEIKNITTPQSLPDLVAIAFIDCRNLAYVVADKNSYFLNTLDVIDFSVNLGGYQGITTTGISALHMSTTQQVTSVAVSNSTGVYLDLFSWSLATPGCGGRPVAVPALSPLSTPRDSPQSTPQIGQSPSNQGTTPSTHSPADNSLPSNSSNSQTNPLEDPEIDPVGLGVGLAVPLAVLGVGAFLLVFFLRKRNKKKQGQNVTQTNPVKDVDSAPPSAPGVYRNLPSNNTSNTTYASLGPNVSNDTYAAVSAIELPDIDKRLHIPYKSLVFIKEIGAGSYGKVFLGEWRGAKVAIKVNNQITDVDGFLAEAKLTLGIAPHPNLVQTFGVSLDGPNPCIVLEYCGGGSLDQVLYDKDAELSVEKQREYAMKIAYGLVHLHNNNIVHRDLAARNILLTNDQQPKISDFGMSRIIQEESSKGHTKTNFGPIRWMAPESLRDRSYSVKSDVWTYGIVVNEILSRQEPHVNEDQLGIALKIRDQAMTPHIPSNSDPVLVEVIHKCLKADPKDRPTMEELCQFMRTKIDSGEQ